MGAIVAAPLVDWKPRNILLLTRRNHPRPRSSVPALRSNNLQRRLPDRIELSHSSTSSRGGHCRSSGGMPPDQFLLERSGSVYFAIVPRQPSRSDDQIPEKSQPASGAVEPNPKSKRVGIGWTSLFAFIFLSLNLVSSFLIPEKVELLWAISPILPFLYLLLLAGSLYALKDLWLTLWNNLRSGWYNKRFHQYWRKQKDQYL